MSKQLIIEQLTSQLNFKKNDIDEIVSKIFECIKEQLVSGNEVSIPKFGKFTVQQRSERTGRNPKTGETIQIPSSKTVKFKSSKILKEHLN